MVERSEDGKAFVEIDRVPGTGAPHYSTTDPAPAALTYYRLRPVDLDGTYVYSKVVTVRRNEGKALRLAEAFPVPSNGRVTVRFFAGRDRRVALRLTNTLGRVIRTENLLIGGNDTLREVDLSGLPAATYHLTLTDGGRVQTIRLVKR